MMVSNTKNKRLFEKMEVENPNKKSKTIVVCEDDINRTPHCPHGPMLLFVYKSLCSNMENCDVKEAFYACAAYRDGNKCRYKVKAPASEKDLTKRFIPEFDWEKRSKLLACKKRNTKLWYCVKCDQLLLKEDVSSHGEHCEKITIKVDDLIDPTKLLKSQSIDKAEAQYFFDTKALELFVDWFEYLNINKVICMGAPRLHAFIKKSVAQNSMLKIKSFLLDLDSRYNNFYEDSEFAWYNMCNNYFFNKNQKTAFEKFLKCTDEENLLIFTDPPYACRTEPIAFTLRQLTKSIHQLNNLVHQPFPIFWIFPYFAEHYIKEVMPELEMFDYKVNYVNHDCYTNVGAAARKNGSAARVFTNVPFENLPIENDNDYKYCKKCCRFTAKENLHCKKCNACTSKNGATYYHCKHCAMCVKPTYVHCYDCRRCILKAGHNCEIYQRYQMCRICLKLGHVERFCNFVKTNCFKNVLSKQDGNAYVNCYICGGKQHNERSCPERGHYLKEHTFMGVTSVKRKKQDSYEANQAEF